MNMPHMNSFLALLHNIHVQSADELCVKRVLLLDTPTRPDRIQPEWWRTLRIWQGSLSVRCQWRLSLHFRPAPPLQPLASAVLNVNAHLCWNHISQEQTQCAGPSALALVTSVQYNAEPHHGCSRKLYAQQRQACTRSTLVELS